MSSIASATAIRGPSDRPPGWQVCKFAAAPTRRSPCRRDVFSIAEDGTAQFDEDVGTTTTLTLEQAFNPDMALLSTFGFNTQRIGRELATYLDQEQIGLDNLFDAAIDQCLKDYKPGPLALYREAVQRGSQSMPAIRHSVFRTAISTPRFRSRRGWRRS